MKITMPIIETIGGSKYIEYIGIGIIIAVAIVVGIILYTKFKKSETISYSDLLLEMSTDVTGKATIAELHQAKVILI